MNSITRYLSDIAPAAACFVLTFLASAAPVSAQEEGPAETEPAAAAGAIVGKISFAGKAPKPAVIRPRQDHHVCGKRRQIVDESLLVSKRGGVANTVLVLEGVEGGAAPAAAAAELQQRNCTFVPHVQTATVGSTLAISNGDAILHNVHAFLSDQTSFNLAMPVKGLRVERELSETGVLSIRCDSGHTWMRAYVVVVPHPYHTTSDGDGAFSIQGVPAGTYTLRAWHERLGAKQLEVTVPAGAEVSVEIEYEDTAKASVDAGAPTAASAAKLDEKLDERLGDLEDSLTETIEETQSAVEALEQQRLWDDRARAESDGRALFVKHCAPCHGRRGDGKGDAAKFLEHPPRDFTKGEYEFRMTPSGVPATEQDLFRTISVGVLGTAMPAWKGKLSRSQRKTLVRYVMSLSPRFWKRRKREPKRIEIPEETANDAESVARGRKLFDEMQCAKCHGKRGRGDGPAASTTKDDWGNPIKPYDLTTGYFQGGKGGKVVYRTISTGLSGTPMPSFGDVLQPEQRWDLVHYILSLAGDGGVGDYLFAAPAGRKAVP